MTDVHPASPDQGDEPTSEPSVPDPVAAAPGGPEPLRGEQEPTGDARVDAAVGRLDELDDAPTAEHVEVFEDVHRRLHDALADLESPG